MYTTTPLKSRPPPPQWSISQSSCPVGQVAQAGPPSVKIHRGGVLLSIESSRSDPRTAGRWLPINARPHGTARPDGPQPAQGNAALMAERDTGLASALCPGRRPGRGVVPSLFLLLFILARPPRRPPPPPPHRILSPVGQGRFRISESVGSSTHRSSSRPVAGPGALDDGGPFGTRLTSCAQFGSDR